MIFGISISFFKLPNQIPVLEFYDSKGIVLFSVYSFWTLQSSSWGELDSDSVFFFLLLFSVNKVFLLSVAILFEAFKLTCQRGSVWPARKIVGKIDNLIDFCVSDRSLFVFYNYKKFLVPLSSFLSLILNVPPFFFFNFVQSWKLLILNLIFFSLSFLFSQQLNKKTLRNWAIDNWSIQASTPCIIFLSFFFSRFSAGLEAGTLWNESFRSKIKYLKENWIEKIEFCVITKLNSLLVLTNHLILDC